MMYVEGRLHKKKREINNSKIKIVPFIINFSGNCKNGASVSEELALFNWSSAGYIQLTICSK